MTTVTWPVRELLWEFHTFPHERAPADVVEHVKRYLLAEIREKAGDTAFIVKEPYLIEAEDVMTREWRHAVVARVAWDHDTYGDPWPVPVYEDSDE